MSAQPKEGAKETLAGEPAAAARSWLGWTALVMFILFAIDTVLVLNGFWLPFDIRIATFVQGLNWGPVVYPLQLINVTAGFWQVLVGIIAIAALLLVDRRAGWLMLIGSISSLLDNIVKLLVSRPRPTVDVVHILTPASGFSYPSGHAVFFTWMSFMLAASLAPRIKPVYRAPLWLVAILVIGLTCIARVWVGDHWPSDVVGGVLLGVGWSAFVLWLPERWLPTPRLRG
jgi:membrane-associated phospholipid phosphatase